MTPLRELAIASRATAATTTHLSGPYLVKVRRHNFYAYIGHAREEFPLVKDKDKAGEFLIYENALHIADKFGGYVVRKSDEQFTLF